MIDFLKAHWPKLSVLLAGLLAFTTYQGCVGNLELSAKLAACEAKPPVSQVQYITVTAKCKGSADVIPVPGSPCPQVRLRLDGDATLAAGQAQNPGAQPTPCPLPPAFGIGVNAGYLDGLYIGPSLDYKWLGVDGKWSPKAVGGGVRLTLRF